MRARWRIIVPGANEQHVAAARDVVLSIVLAAAQPIIDALDRAHIGRIERLAVR